MSTVLSGLAIVISLGSLAVAIWAVRRDSARLVVRLTSGFVADGTGTSLVILEVQNPSRYTEIVTNLGLTVRHRHRWREQWFKVRRAARWQRIGTREFIYSRWATRVGLPGELRPGDARSVVIPFDEFVAALEEGGARLSGIYAYAKSGRRYFARAPKWLATVPAASSRQPCT